MDQTDDHAVEMVDTVVGQVQFMHDLFGMLVDYMNQRRGFTGYFKTKKDVGIIRGELAKVLELNGQLAQSIPDVEVRRLLESTLVLGHQLMKFSS